MGTNWRSEWGCKKLPTRLTRNVNNLGRGVLAVMHGPRLWFPVVWVLEIQSSVSAAKTPKVLSFGCLLTSPPSCWGLTPQHLDKGSF
jgi:hypothetical protein